MSVVLVTGSAGLIGSSAVRFFSGLGMDVVGIDNDMRSYFFGEGASTVWNRDDLQRQLPTYRHANVDIRDRAGLEGIFKEYGKNLAAIIHTAAQPSHDWAAREPHVDFEVNANGTLNLLELTRQHAPEAPFIFTSTNKVYGDTPNALPLVEMETRWEIEPGHRYEIGIDETMSIDQTKHSLFGASKVAADVLVQEYGRYFGMPTGCFRGGCITGPQHSGAALHGFLAYLVKCAVTDQPYTIIGYKGKQVRDNIHCDDLVSAFYHFFKNPRPAEVYNLGGSRFSNCSVIEAVKLCEQFTGREMKVSYQEQNRSGDHIWWVSDVSKFRSHYPEWDLRHSFKDIVGQIFEASARRAAESQA